MKSRCSRAARVWASLLILASAHLLAPLSTHAQSTRSLVPEIRTVRLLLNGESGQLPVLQLGSQDVLEVSFDDLTHEYERFEYRLIHCDRDWQPSSGILMSDAVDFTSESLPVEDYEYSMNTTQLYTHYRFEVPSADVRPRISGNYRVEISRDGDYDDELVAIASFMVVERQAHVNFSVTDNTEIDWKQSHQQVQLTVDFSALTPTPLNPQEDISIVVLQNQRWDNAKRHPQPDYVNGTRLQWQHSRELIFDAGNEYRRFENTTTRHAAMGMESLRWFDPYYHARLRLGEPRRHYIYERDQNGLCVVRTTESPDSDSEADYMLVHFELAMPELPGATVYVQGQWTNCCATPENTMHYDSSRSLYECVMLLKQGYYNYQFLVASEAGAEESFCAPGLSGPIEGDFAQTENEYNVLVYYRNAFDRYDRLIGWR